MNRYSMIALLVTLLPACPGRVYNPTCEDQIGDLGKAVDRVAAEVLPTYRHRMPPDFDTRAYFAIAQRVLLEPQLDLLRSVDLEVWTREDCESAIVVVRCRTTQRVLLIDDTIDPTAPTVPNALIKVNVEVPKRPDKPPTCPLPANP